MRLATFALIAVVVAAPAGLTSKWRTEAVNVDGLSTDWQTPEPLERGLTVGAVNDGEFLYLVVSARDPESIAYISTGLIVWLDPAGRRGETFGLRLEGVEQPLLPGMTPTAPAAGPAEHLDDGARPIRCAGSRQEPAPTGGSHSGTRHRDRVEPRGDRSGVRTENPAAEDVVAHLCGRRRAGPYDWSRHCHSEAPVGRGQRPRLVGDSGFIGGDPWYGGGFAKYREDDGKRKPLEIWTTMSLASGR